MTPNISSTAARATTPLFSPSFLRLASRMAFPPGVGGRQRRLPRIFHESPLLLPIMPLSRANNDETWGQNHNTWPLARTTPALARSSVKTNDHPIPHSVAVSPDPSAELRARDGNAISRTSLLSRQSSILPSYPSPLLHHSSNLSFSFHFLDLITPSGP